MYKEHISNSQAFSIVAFFVMGSTLILGTGGQAKNDAWIAIIVGMLAVLPFLLIYARIISLFPGRDLFDILQLTMGRVIGKVIILIYTWYGFHLGALVIRNFGEFVNTAAMPETPILVSMLFIGLLSTWAVKSGIEVIGRVALFLLPLIMLVILIVQLLIIPQMKFSFLLPVLDNGWKPVLEGAFSAFSFPFAETVLLTTVFFSLKDRKAPYKVNLTGVLFSGLVTLFLGIRNITVLGAPVMSNLYFPSYAAVSRVEIGEFIQRIEVTVVVVFISAAFIKISICLFAACNGIAKVFALKSYRPVVIPTGLLMIYFADIVYDNIMEMQEWAFKVYEYYAIPFQVILPIIILITAEVRIRSKKLKIKD